jgi:multiple sugar transport system substrate-binding protein
VDCVLTFEELQALFDGRGIEIAELEESALDNASAFGRIFARSGGLCEAVAEAMKEQDMVNEFENGRLAFMVDGISHLTTIKNESPDLNFTYAPMPKADDYDGASGLDVACWGIGIAENCEHKEEAMAFVEYMMSPEVNAKLAQLANAFPGNSKAEPDYSANDELFLKAFDIFQEGYAINEFTGAPTAEDLMRSMNEQLILYFDGDTASADEMLAATQEAWEAAYN